jgi:hypothetical protein
MVALDYDGRRFSSEAAETDGSDGTAPVGSYHQSGDLVWAEFAGGSVRTGRLVGTCGPDGVIEAAYVQLLDGGELAAGRMASRPHLLPDGRVRLEERWRRVDRYRRAAAHPGRHGRADGLVRAPRVAQPVDRGTARVPQHLLDAAGQDRLRAAAAPR